MVRPSAREAATQAGRALLNLLPVMGFLSLVDPSLRNADPNAAAAIAAHAGL